MIVTNANAYSNGHSRLVPSTLLLRESDREMSLKRIPCRGRYWDGSSTGYRGFRPLSTQRCRARAKPWQRCSLIYISSQGFSADDPSIDWCPSVVADERFLACLVSLRSTRASALQYVLPHLWPPSFGHQLTANRARCPHRCSHLRQSWISWQEDSQADAWKSSVSRFSEGIHRHSIRFCSSFSWLESQRIHSSPLLCKGFLRVMSISTLQRWRALGSCKENSHAYVVVRLKCRERHAQQPWVCLPLARLIAFRSLTHLYLPWPDRQA